MNSISKEKFINYTFNDLKNLVLWILSNILSFKQIEIKTPEGIINIDIEVNIYREEAGTLIVEFNILCTKENREFTIETFVFGDSSVLRKGLAGLARSPWHSSKEDYYENGIVAKSCFDYTDSIYSDKIMNDMEKDINISMLDIFNKIIESINRRD